MTIGNFIEYKEEGDRWTRFVRGKVVDIIGQDVTVLITQERFTPWGKWLDTKELKSINRIDTRYSLVNPGAAKS